MPHGWKETAQRNVDPESGYGLALHYDNSTASHDAGAAIYIDGTYSCKIWSHDEEILHGLTEAEVNVHLRSAGMDPTSGWR